MMRGPLAWMARNGVAANLLMAVLLLGGIAMTFQIKQEVFPEFDLDLIAVGVPLPGASPEEVESGIVVAIEEAVRGLDGVKEVRASANENAAGVSVELELGTDPSRALSDVKNAIDRITSFPEAAERPVVNQVANLRHVLAITLYGDVPEDQLRRWAEFTRDGIIDAGAASRVDIVGIRPKEIHIDLSNQALRRLGMTHREVAQRVREMALEISGGKVKTPQGELLLRTAERRDHAADFADIPIAVTKSGRAIRLGELAQLRDGFADNDLYAEFDGVPGVLINVYRTGEETPLSIARDVRAYLDTLRRSMPESLSVKVTEDRSESYRERLSLLSRNAAMGLVLVLVVLGLFLDIRLALWVTLGIPISFLGSLLLVNLADVSINMISLFAFIVTLGIVVDDAIVVGESIYEERGRTPSRLESAIRGAKRVSVPVVFSVLTTMTAFAPLLFIPGVSGKFFGVIPVVVISVLAISLVESLLILPAHLSHRAPATARPPQHHGPWRWLNPRYVQPRFDRWLQHFIQHRYGVVLRRALERPGIVMAAGLGVMILTLGLYLRLGQSFLPRVDADRVTAYLTMPYENALQDTVDRKDAIVAAAERALRRLGDDRDALTLGIGTLIGAHATGGGPSSGESQPSGAHLASVRVYLPSSDARDFSTGQFVALWREEMADISGFRSLNVKYTTGPGGTGSDITVELSHSDLRILEAASEALAGKLTEYDAVTDVDDGYPRGKAQLSFKVNDRGSALGFRAQQIGGQVRDAFFGAEALRQQVGRDEVKVLVRLPESERVHRSDVERLILKTPGQQHVTLASVATVIEDSSLPTIRRRDGRRIVTVGADVRRKPDAFSVIGDLKRGYLKELQQKYPGLQIRLEGDSRSRSESMASMVTGFMGALIVIFAMLAIPLKSYVQPLVIMGAIPFGWVGALWGHALFGFNVSIMSYMGIFAVSGIVINDSLVLVYAANQYRAEGMSLLEAVHAAGKRRFRPIVLTSLTTFFGLMPMILEPSVQARFLVPMAVGLAFGVLCATVFILLLVPSIYILVERGRAWLRGGAPAEPSGGEPALVSD